MQLKALLDLWRLKEVKRAGWLRVGIKNPESVADHSFFVALLALLLPLPKDVDRNKLIKLTLIHDLAEAFVGDIVWRRKGKVLSEELARKKREAELEVMEMLAKALNNKELLELFLEYEAQQSKEAKIAKELDKFEMAIQAVIYARKADTSEFIEDASLFIKTKELRKLFEELIKVSKA